MNECFKKMVKEEEEEFGRAGGSHSGRATGREQGGRKAALMPDLCVVQG
jgi:hypothetical protein